MATLFSGGLIFDGTESLVSDHAVLVENGIISELAPTSEFSGFDGEQVDFSGGTLMPGLFDCHVHLIFSGSPDPFQELNKLSAGDFTIQALENAQTALAGGITAVRDCGGKDYLEFAVRDSCNSGRTLGPVISAAGRMICMTGGHGNNIARVADGVDDVVRAVREQVHAGSDLIKIMATGGVMTPGVNPEDAHYTAEEMAAGIYEGHRFHKRCASHAQGRDGILNAVRGGIDSIEHGIFMDQTCIEEMIEKNTYLVPTLAAINNILNNSGSGIPDYVVEKCERVAKAHRNSIQQFYAAGGRIAMGTDAGTPFNLHGQNALELRYMVEVGMSSTDALRAATSAAADLCDLGNRGRIVKGAVADFLMVNGNPVADIEMAADKGNHRFVIKEGVVVAGNSGTVLSG
ncbi:MAG TPA: amidohydrolase family protein [Arenicellales bacterium]|jgi:imidazolonepropionase-like amidohydrolase|nr:amidohydrolase family protein [Arenicellales bacterium]|tara:strand:- start:3886 stop:5094 length:1209 start_codon:yes stop_codon:yes gene_type:complete